MGQTQVSIEQIQQARNLNIGRLMLRGHRDFQLRSAEKLRERGYADLTLAQTVVLTHLDIKGTRIITLAERAGMAKQSMGELVQELEQHGYVARTPDPTDRRAVLITFTEAGLQFLQDAYQIKQEIEAEYEAILGTEGFTLLKSLLTQLLEETEHVRIE